MTRYRSCDYCGVVNDIDKGYQGPYCVNCKLIFNWTWDNYFRRKQNREIVT